MTFLEKFQKSLEEVLIDSVKVEINGLDLSENKELIFKRSLSTSRLIEPFGQKNIRINVHIGEYRDIFFTGNVTEFPYCCGAAVFYGFKLYERYVNNHVDGVPNVIVLSNEVYNKCINIILKLISDICKFCGYASYFFIVSQKEQTLFYKGIISLGHEEINTFKNHRMEMKHACTMFTINVESARRLMLTNLEFAEII